MELKVYYSVQKGGDGSAHPRFLESEKVAEWDQNHMDEGWGEPCTGSITMEGDSLTCIEAQSTVGYYLDLLLKYEDRDQARDFKAEFFPDRLPTFHVGISQELYYGIYVGSKLVYEEFAYPENKADETGRRKLDRKLQNVLCA